MSDHFKPTQSRSFSLADDLVADAGHGLGRGGVTVRVNSTARSRTSTTTGAKLGETIALTYDDSPEGATVRMWV